MSSPPVISGVGVAQFLVCSVLFVLLSFLLLAIVLSVLLRFTPSDYPFGIVTLFVFGPKDWKAK